MYPSTFWKQQTCFPKMLPDSMLHAAEETCLMKVDQLSAQRAPCQSPWCNILLSLGHRRAPTTQPLKTWPIFYTNPSSFISSALQTQWQTMSSRGQILLHLHSLSKHSFHLLTGSCLSLMTVSPAILSSGSCVSLTLMGRVPSCPT